MQRLFWHFYLFIFLVLLALGWTVEQLWQQWQPSAEPPWLNSYTSLLQQQLQQPTASWASSTGLNIVALANDSQFGLVASVVTRDAEAADRVANVLQAGLVWINAPQVIFPQTAWGGYKQSSIGRELGPWGLAAFQEIKHVIRAL